MQVVLNIVIFWLQVEILYFAGECKVNAGVIMSLFSIKPIVSFLMFYIVFGSTITMIETFGMLIAVVAVFIISISKLDLGIFDQQDSENNIMFMISILLTIPVAFWVWVRNLTSKMYFNSTGAFGEVFLVQILAGFVVSIIMLVGGISMFIFGGFRFATSDLIYGMIGGVINFSTNVLSVVVIVKGNPGPADALVETSPLFLTLFEAAIFFRIPNLLQYIGIALSFISTGFIIVGSHSK